MGLCLYWSKSFYSSNDKNKTCLKPFSKQWDLIRTGSDSQCSIRTRSSAQALPQEGQQVLLEPAFRELQVVPVR